MAEQATLEAALALMDACESPLMPEAAVVPKTCVGPTPAAHHPEPEQDALSPPSSAAQRWRKRQRTEKARLRDQVADLEAHLTLLQRYCGQGATASAEAESTAEQSPPDVGDHEDVSAALGARVLSHLWFKKAVAEFTKVQRAKQRNRHLKDAVQEQRQVCAALEQLFQLKLSKQDLDFLAAIAKQNAVSEVNTIGSDLSTAQTSQFVDMLVHLEKLYACTPEILSHITTRRNTSRVFASSHFERDPVLGSSHEFTTNTPLSCRLSDLEHFLWQQIGVSARIECRKPCHHFIQASQANQVCNRGEKHVSIEFTETVGGYRMVGTFVIRKFVEPHRIVLVLTTRITFSESALVIRENGWVVLTDLETSSSIPSLSSTPSPTDTLFQTHCRIFVEAQDPNMTPEMVHLQEFVVNFMSEKMKSNKLQIQNLMLQVQDAVNVTEKVQRELSFECIACGFLASSSGEEPTGSTALTTCEPSILSSISQLHAFATGASTHQHGASPPSDGVHARRAVLCPRVQGDQIL